MLRERVAHPLAALAAAVLVTAPWVGVELAGGPGALGLSEPVTVAVSGVAVLGASFLLAWGAETAEKDVPRAFAIAVLAVLAVAPEYAVDALYAWTAGTNAGTARGVEAANLAVANTTGANRILIGLGWSGIAMFTVYRSRTTADAAVERRPGFLASAVQLDRNISTEIAFLLAATATPSSSPWAAASASSTRSCSSGCTSPTSASSSGATSRRPTTRPASRSTSRGSGGCSGWRQCWRCSRTPAR